MAAIVKAYKEYWDEMLAVGLGVIFTDVAGNTVKTFVGPWLEGIGLGQWVDPISEGLIGLGVLGVTEMLLSPVSKFKIYGRLIGFGATAVAIADAVAIATGQIAMPARPAPRPAAPRPTRATPTVRPPPTVIPPPTASPSPAAKVTVKPAPTTLTRPATPTKAPKIFGS
jgi:hypothetical protein